MNQIIANANAPVVKITIQADFRYNPPALSVDCSQTMPALIVQNVLLKCAENLNLMMQQAEQKNSKNPVAPLPDLPPAPQSN